MNKAREASQHTSDQLFASGSVPAAFHVVPLSEYPATPSPTITARFRVGEYAAARQMDALGDVRNVNVAQSSVVMMRSLPVVRLPHTMNIPADPKPDAQQ